ncbi:MAG: asparaginase domain-containing protein [Eubacteriales bacterium]
MNKILICFTGGTFGSKTSKKGVMDVSKKAYRWFIDYIEETYKGEIEFTYISPVMMLSENMHPEIWEKITKDINETFQYNHDFDGMIVIHGSDTAVYTTAFLGYYYKRLPIPIVVTAANAPIREVRSNGLNNFEASVDFILKEKRLGTYFIYQQKGHRGDIVVYPSDGVLNASPYSNEFESTTSEPYGIMRERQFIGQPDERKPVEYPTWRFDAFIYKNKVMGIVPYVGLDYSTFNLKGISVAVHGAFHSNTFNTLVGADYVQYSLQSFIDRCKAEGIYVYLADFPVNRLDSPVYESTQSLVDEGAQVIYSPMESVFAKAVYAYNQSARDPKQVMLEE